MAFSLAVQGCKTTSSLNPCPICIVVADKTRGDSLKLSQQLLVPAVPREPQLPIGKHSKEHKSLLYFSPDEIVPLPLHILLGLCNRMTYKELLGAEKLKQAWDSVKSTRRGNPEWLIFSVSTVRSCTAWSAETIIAPVLNAVKLSRAQHSRAAKCQL